MRTTSLICAGMLFSIPAHAYVIQTSQSGAELHFTAMPQYFYLSNAGSADVGDDSELEAFRRAFASWEAVPDCDARFSKLGSTNKGLTDVFNEGGLPGRDKVNLVVWVEEGWQESPAQLAVTYTYFIDVSGKILEDDITMNGDDYGPWTTGDTGAQYDVESIAAHEIGHAFGLAHSLDPEATMFATASIGESKKRTLEADDMAGVTHLYPTGCCRRHAGHDLLASLGCAVAPGTNSPLSLTALAGALGIWLARRKCSPRRRTEAHGGKKGLGTTIRSLRVPPCASVVILVLSVAISAEASVARDQSLSELVAASESVIHGRVIWQETSEGPNGSIMTLTQIEVDEVLAGHAGPVITIVEPGGVAPSGIGLHVSGAPRYEIGEEVIVFTEPPRGGYEANFPDALRTTAMAQGKLRVVRENGEVRVKRDLSGVARVSPEGWITLDLLDGMSLETLRLLLRPIELKPGCADTFKIVSPW